VQFDIDLDLDGNHVLTCPNCGHEHCRVVKGGRITGIRWDRRNGPRIVVPQNTVTYSTNSTYNINYNQFLNGAWLNTASDSTAGTIYINYSSSTAGGT
jgi:hypothetical protein